MKKGFLCLASLLVASFMAMPAVAPDESVVTLSGNGYITAGPENGAFIDEQHCEIRNWNNSESVTSFYFRTEKAGKMNVAILAKGDSRIEVSLLGKKKPCGQ